MNKLCLLALLPLTVQALEIPADARDPHAYANGFTLTSGPYAMPGPRLLKMADEHRQWAVLAERLEYEPDDERGAYDLTGWYGTTFNRLQINAEGDIADGKLEESQTELLWNHGFSAFHDTLLGVRLDSHDGGEDRQWLAAGVQGLLPFWVEYSAMLYAGDEGRTGLGLKAAHELMFSQRLVLASRAELNAWGKDDAVNGTGSGFSDVTAGIRLRYDLSRHFGPYAGIDWNRSLGKTASYLREAEQPVSDTHYLLGLRFWF